MVLSLVSYKFIHEIKTVIVLEKKKIIVKHGTNNIEMYFIVPSFEGKKMPLCALNI